jgi:hypothetical protein
MRNKKRLFIESWGHLAASEAVASIIKLISLGLDPPFIVLALLAINASASKRRAAIGVKS